MNPSLSRQRCILQCGHIVRIVVYLRYGDPSKPPGRVSKSTEKRPGEGSDWRDRVGFQVTLIRTSSPCQSCVVCQCTLSRAKMWYCIDMSYKYRCTVFKIMLNLEINFSDVYKNKYKMVMLIWIQNKYVRMYKSARRLETTFKFLRILFLTVLASQHQGFMTAQLQLVLRTCVRLVWKSKGHEGHVPLQPP